MARNNDIKIILDTYGNARAQKKSVVALGRAGTLYPVGGCPAGHTRCVCG